MFNVFLFAAVIGGTIFVFQFVLALVGMGTEDVDFGDGIPEDLDLADGTIPLDHGSTSLFGVISLRTVVAAVTFFGLAGMAALEGGLHDGLAALIAIASGLAAMYAVHWLMKQLYNLRQDGSVRIQRSLGKTATVYIPIPAGRSGSGKIQIRMQGRIMEYAAITGGPEKLSTGAKVVVIDVVTPTTLEVEPIRETVASA
ncbi:MAG: hypothetical protein P8N76_02925 [Pirellulaceae bacterium]|nr:hypothetical protein [Pirellulaceae bacterium]